MLKENPNMWTQHAFAKDSNGVPIDVLDSKASCFCTTGLLLRFKSDITEVNRILNNMAEHLYGFGTSFSKVAIWNDMKRRTVEDVIELYEKIGE